ncbi:hypothetical protein V9T40_010457 [Parthenolecanium corni]|uniref:C2H2-type domain-containing protein n=1 Tax=Parthenolecanium corni TaxID=536013 RepID=A0AAN9TB48_9HEMI
MDQILSAYNDEVNDEFDSKCDSLVNQSEGEIFENFSNPIGDGIGSGCRNESNKSPTKSSDNVLGSESCTSDNNISSTSCSENEVMKTNTNAEISLNIVAKPNAEASISTEAKTNTEAGINTEVEPYAEAGTNTEVGTNAEASPNTEANTEAEANSEASTSTAASTNITANSETEASINIEANTNIEGNTFTKINFNADVSTNTEAITNAEAESTSEANTYVDPNTNIANNSNTEASINIEANTTTETDINAGASSNTEVSNNIEAINNIEANNNAEALTNADSLQESNDVRDDISKLPNICDGSGKEVNPVNDETLDHRNNFLPTIVAIRGGCTDVLEKTSDPSSSNPLHKDSSSSTSSQIPSLNIVSVLGGCKEIDLDREINKTNEESNLLKLANQIVHAISDSEESVVLNKCSDNLSNNDITIKEEPHDIVSDNDCVFIETERTTNPVTSKFPIPEKKTSNPEGEDVICIETTSKIPSPILIKTETNIEDSNVQAESQKSNKNEKVFAKKRMTRASLSQSDDCIILSSSSDKDSVSDSKKRNRLSKNVPYSTAGYSCHLCNTVFQEHELLNEHMILHRNNSLIEAKVQNRSKTTKVKSYSCDICDKQLSTSQSLQQHVLIHKNEKPFVCHFCQKDFRHLQNYRAHLQKHKAEQRRRGGGGGGGGGKTQQKDGNEQLNRSVVRSVDFGRLVGPLFMKENLLHKEKDTNAPKSVPSNATSPSVAKKKTTFRYSPSTKESPYQPRLSFDQPPFKTKENASSSSPIIIRRREPSPRLESDDECVAVKSFSNIESVVMNATKIIVKLDNVDTSVLKRKIQTPDISIDQPPKKCRIMLSPIAEKCNIKLDEIENIPMDIDAAEIDLPAAEPTDSNRDYRLRDDTGEAAGSAASPLRYTLSDNELFDLLNDDRDNVSSADCGDAGSSGTSQISKPELYKADDPVKIAESPVIKRSNVIFMEIPAGSETCSYEDEETIDDKLYDAFDAAFQKVATRRLVLLRKRAAENGGKVESRYMLGPLFWRKALRRAQKRMSNAIADANVNITIGGSKNGRTGAVLRTWTGQVGGRSRFDDRRTNDPTKLQLRAERKFKYLLELAKMLENLNTLNLTGPLFWRRTLQLAGVHRGEDLRTYISVTSPTLDGVEFVNADGEPHDFDAVLVSAEQQKMSPPQPSDAVQPSTSDQVQPSLSHRVQPALSDQVQPSSHRAELSPLELPAIGVAALNSDGQQKVDQLVGGGRMSSASDVVAADVSMAKEIQPSIAHAEQPRYDSSAQNTPNEVTSGQTDSILYESLTRPKECSQQSTKAEKLAASFADSTSLFVASQDIAVKSSPASHSNAELLENRSADQLNLNCDESTGNVTVDESITKLAAIDSGSIVLNVDNGGGLQLIPAGDQVPISETGQNFVLVSDGTGTMQYMVNVSNDNFANFELIGNGAGEDQVAYAIQFDGENYAAVQFVQDGSIQLESDRSLKEAQMLVDPKAAAYLVSDNGATAAAVADPNHIGKELSDFLNLDYGTLLKNGTADRPIS